MTQICEAIFENGIFRPVGSVGQNLEEGQHVRLVVETSTPDEILELASLVYDGLDEREIDEVERFALERSSFFTKLDQQ